FLRWVLECGGGPDHRNVRCLSDPHDFLLKFSSPLVTTFYRQISARDHYAEPLAAHRRQDQLRQLFEGLARLDFEDNAKVLSADFRQLLLEQINIRWISNKRISNRVCMGSNER